MNDGSVQENIVNASNHFTNIQKDDISKKYYIIQQDSIEKSQNERH